MEESKKLNKIVLKDKQLTYEDVCAKYLKNDIYFIESDGNIGYISGTWACNHTPNCSKTQHQLECILAKNKLANVAKYLNNGWRPDNDEEDYGWIIYSGHYRLDFEEASTYDLNSNVLFKSEELARQAVEILGEETIRLALKPLGI